MPTREQLEEELGKRWAAMARREGHKRALPSNTKPAGTHMNTEAKAATLLRVMEANPKAEVKRLAKLLNATIDDTRLRLMYLQRSGRVKLINKVYEVVE